MDVRSTSDIEYLRQLALVQKSQIEQLLRVLSSKCKELETLKGDTSELQRTLGLVELLQRKAADAAKAEAKAAEETPKPPRPKRPGHGPTAQPSLPRIPEVCALSGADLVCDACRDEMAELEGQAERSEMIDVIEVQYRIVAVERKKYVCTCGGSVKTAPGPARAIPGGRYSLPFAVKVAVDKYLDHLPLERQVRIMARHGLTVTSQALWDQLWQVAQWLRPTWAALLATALKQRVIGIDQTCWPNLDKKPSKNWQMWCVTADRIVYHSIRGDKGTESFVDLIGGYEGCVVCDAAKTHESGARASPGIILCGCWAHVRRYFDEAEVDHPEARVALDLIRTLYDIDEAAANAEERGVLRSTQSRAVIESLQVWLRSQRTLKTTTIGRAVRYTLACWPRLVRFLDDPAIWLDNNPTERGLRGPVVGRRNHFGSKSRRGTEVAAILYSLIETAKLCGVDPAAYLIEACSRAQRAPGTVLLPADFAAELSGAA
jgi:transposase